MTMLATRKTTCRAETSAMYRGRPLVVTLEPHEVIIRQKGRRTAFAVPYQAVIEAGMKLAAIEARKLREEKRKLRRGR